MKVLLINGSPRGKGNTYIALSEVAKALREDGLEAEIVSIGTRAVQGCIACNRCAELGHCVFNDSLYATVREKRSVPCSTACFIPLPLCSSTSLRPL